MIWILAFFTVSGVSMTFWGLVSIIRFIWEEILPFYKRKRSNCVPTFTREQVAVIVPAHNEEAEIGRTIDALRKLVSTDQIYIGSDASTDRTTAIARATGCNVADIWPNRGKAGVLQYLLEHFHLYNRYEAVVIVDADTEIDEHYLAYAIPYFADPAIVAIAAHAVTRWEQHWWPRWSMFFIAYRVRLYRFLQALMRYGQTWQFTNATSIVPGFASMYRTSALRQINIDAPNLIIEDFNMTFELHHKHLGKVAYHPRIFGKSEDPHTFRDYWHQVKRWDLGFWQTVRRHGVWPSFFWLATGVFILEMIVFSCITLSIPFALLGFMFTGFEPFVIRGPDILPYVLTFRLSDLYLGIFLADYLLTVAVVLTDRKPMLLIYGLFFFPLRIIDSFLYLYTLPLAFFVTSTGSWKSPARLSTTTIMH